MRQVSFDQVAAAYDGFMGRWTHLFLPALLRVARVAPGHRVLDLATGTGESARALADAVAPGGAVTGVDLSLPMLRAARAKLAGRPIALVAGDALAVPCRPAAFDRVVSQLGLMFFPDPVAGAREAHRVLRSGGRFAAVVWSARERVTWSAALARALEPHVPGREAELRVGTRLGDPRLLAAILTDAGFHDVSVEAETRAMSFASFEAYWTHVESGAIRMGLMLRDLPPAAAAAIRAEVREALSAHATGEGFVMPSEVLVAGGTR